MIGGSGFLGRHVAARLTADGHCVSVMTRARHQHRDLLVLPTLTLVEGDPYDQQDMSAFLADQDIVINLVGILNEKGHRGAGFERAHVEMTAALLAAARAAGIHRYVQISSLKADPDGPSFYARTKGRAEALVRESSEYGIDWTILQPSVVFGRNDDFINRFAALLKNMPVFPLACANSRLQPVYVGDVADAVLKAVTDPTTRGRTYQCCGPKVYSLREIVVLIASTLGLRRKVVRLSPSMGRLQARIMEYVPGKPFSVDNYQSLTVHNICDRSGHNLADLGIEPSAMEPIIARYLRAS